MSIFTIFPVEYEGMSIITLMFIAIGSAWGSIGIGIYLKWNFNKFKQQDEKLDKHDEMFAKVIDDSADSRVQSEEMNGRIIQTQMVVGRIDESLNKIASTNTKVIESFIKKGS